MKKTWIAMIVLIMIVFTECSIKLGEYRIGYQRPVFITESCQDDNLLSFETVHFNMDDSGGIRTAKKQNQPALRPAQFNEKQDDIYYEYQIVDSQETYQWVDEYGIKHFADRLPEDKDFDPSLLD